MPATHGTLRGHRRATPRRALPLPWGRRGRDQLRLLRQSSNFKLGTTPWVELDDGKQAQLKPGDIVIQNGMRHRWRNTGKKPCVMYSVLVGAPRR